MLPAPKMNRRLAREIVEAVAASRKKTNATVTECEGGLLVTIGNRCFTISPEAGYPFHMPNVVSGPNTFNVSCETSSWSPQTTLLVLIKELVTGVEYLEKEESAVNTGGITKNVTLFKETTEGSATN